jgi:hypothetical protein
MEENWEDVIVELERTTAAVATLDLSAADFRRILEIMNRRSEVVARLRKMTAATASPALIERPKVRTYCAMHRARPE